MPETGGYFLIEGLEIHAVERVEGAMDAVRGLG